MLYAYCLLGLLFSLVIFMIGFGLINIFKKDWAWRIAEMTLRSVRPQRTAEWERNATIKGWILIVAGLLYLFLLSRIFLAD